MEILIISVYLELIVKFETPILTSSKAVLAISILYIYLHCASSLFNFSLHYICFFFSSRIIYLFLENLVDTYYMHDPWIQILQTWKGRNCAVYSISLTYCRKMLRLKIYKTWILELSFPLGNFFKLLIFILTVNKNEYVECHVWKVLCSYEIEIKIFIP